MEEKLNRIIISGGGTGGHIFPAIAIANELRANNPEVKILFVGAEGKMEMEKVPKAGYEIVALPIVGLQRKLTLKNLVLPFKLLKSLMLARKILRKFKPEVVVGVGGYASGPLLKMATSMKIPSLIQEQNSFPGKTNKILAKSVQKICVAYEGLEKFFPKEKIAVTGNPVRFDVVQIEGKRKAALEFFGLNENNPILLVIGGSLGAKTLNDSIENGIEKFTQNNIQVIWQCGSYYIKSLKEKLGNKLPENIILTDFIQRMDYAYALADVIISRAGAISISELCLIKKPVILVPSPNVAEDHQTKNAMALVDKNAAILVKDSEARTQLVAKTIALLADKEKQTTLSENSLLFGKPAATKNIVNEIYKLCK